MTSTRPVGTSSGRKPMSDEELARRNRERAARINQQLKFPWKPVITGLVAAGVIIFILGPSVLALFLVMAMAGGLTASNRKGRKFPF